MWIKRDEYEYLVRRNDNLKTQIDEWRSYMLSLQDKMNALDKQCKKEVELYKNLYEEYKQKYADEVQKRLELIDFMKNSLKIPLDK